MSLEAVAAGMGTGASLIIAIGAQNAFVLRQALGGRHVAAVVAMCVVSDILLITLGVAGMGALVAKHPALLAVLRAVGAVFVGAYGVAAAIRAVRGTSGLAPAGRGATTRRAALLTCLAFTFLNPRTYLDTVVLLGSLSTRYASPWSFGAGAILASAVWFPLLGGAGRLLGPLFGKPRAWRVLDAAMAAFMIVLAIRIA